MMREIISLPLVLIQFEGTVEVVYRRNESAFESGFDLFESLGFDSIQCLSYPTITAVIKDSDGNGYYTSSGWIQVLSNELYNEKEVQPKMEPIEVDVNPIFEKLGIPFFTLGYPSTLYYASCDNLKGHAKSIWRAQAFMVTHPSRINSETIEYVLGLE